MKKLIIATMITMICCSIGIKVNAAAIDNWSTQQARVQTTHDGTDTWTSWTNINGDNAVIFNNLTNPVKAISWRVKATNGLSKYNMYTFKFSYKPNPDAIHPSSYYIQNDSTGEIEDATCVITRNEDSGYYWYECSFEPGRDYTSSQYLYIKINFTLSYLTEMRMSIRGYNEREGTGAIITDTSNQIINNANNNTQEIIDNLTQANEQLIQSIQDENQVCNLIDKNYIEWDNKQLKNDGTLLDNNLSGVTRYINIQKATITELEVYAEGYLNRFCFYDVNKNYISCQDNAQINEITIPNNAVYFRSTIVKNANKPKYRICQNGNQAMISEDHTYENVPDITTEVNQEQQLEQNINNNLDTQFLDDMNITLGTEPSNYVWNKMTMIYNLNSKWQIFIYTVLGLGIIKLILGR